MLENYKKNIKKSYRFYLVEKIKTDIEELTDKEQYDLWLGLISTSMRFSKYIKN